MGKHVEILVVGGVRNCEKCPLHTVSGRAELLTEQLGHSARVPTKHTAAPCAQHDLLVPEHVNDIEHEADALAHGADEHLVLHLVFLARTAGVRGGDDEHVGIRMDVLAGEPDLGHDEPTVAVQVAVDVAAAVFPIPIALLLEHVVEERLGAQRLLLRPGPADIAAARVGERGEVEHRQVAELGATATGLENRRDGVRIDDAHLGNASLDLNGDGGLDATHAGQAPLDLLAVAHRHLLGMTLGALGASLLAGIGTLASAAISHEHALLTVPPTPARHRR